MKILLFITMFILSSTLYSQDKINFEVNKINYVVKYYKSASGKYNFAFENESNNKKYEFSLFPLTQSLFINQFNIAYDSIKTDSKKLSEENINENVIPLFYKLISDLLNESEVKGPLSGNLTVNKQIPVYATKRIYTKTKKDKDGNIKKDKNGRILYKKFSKRRQDTLVGNFKVKDIEIEFYEGYIEVIKVNGDINFIDTLKNENKHYRFENRYGIGFSTKKNFKNLSKSKLSYGKYHFFHNTHIKCSDLIDYNYYLGSQRKDFSPGNQIVALGGGQSVDLYKDVKSKLFEVVIYSDFIGLDNDKPNGLVQSEISKRINLNSKKRGLPLTGGYGWFQYIKPFVSISKIETKNMYLSPDKKENITAIYNGIDSVYKVNSELSTTPINVTYYQKYSLGSDINFLYFDFPESKLHFIINTLFRLSKTPVIDSISVANKREIKNSGLTKNFELYNFNLGIEGLAHIMPEERLGMTISYKLIWFINAFNSIPLMSLDRNGAVQDNIQRKINLYELQLYFKTSETAKLFARWRFANQWGNIYSNFNQVQVGYSTYLFNK